MHGSENVKNHESCYLVFKVAVFFGMSRFVVWLKSIDVSEGSAASIIIIVIMIMIIIIIIIQCILITLLYIMLF